MAKHRILLVSYHYPPWGGSGVQRPAALARRWAEQGAEVHVLTTGHSFYPLHDGTLEDGVSAGVNVHRVNGCDPGGLATRLVPVGVCNRQSMLDYIRRRIYWRAQRFADRHAMLGGESWWQGTATRAALRLVEKYDIETLVTTSPPHAIQQIGVQVKRETGVKWIADLRDPMMDNFAFKPTTLKVHDRWRKLEIDTVQFANRVVVTCEDYKSHLTAKYHLVRPQIRCITNGYEARHDSGTAPRPEVGDVFTLAHVGALYHDQSPKLLLEACRKLRYERRDFRDRFRLKLVGSIAGHLMSLFEDGDADFVERVGYVDRSEASREMSESDALFLMTPSHPHGLFCYPGKTFEYLATDTPILALIHERASISELLSRAGGVARAYHEQAGSLKHELELLFDRWLHRVPNQLRNNDYVRTFQRDRLADEYLDLICRRASIDHLESPNTGVESSDLRARVES